MVKIQYNGVAPYVYSNRIGFNSRRLHHKILNTSSIKKI